MFYSFLVPATPFWLQQNGKNESTDARTSSKRDLIFIQKLLFQFLKQTYLACLIDYLSALQTNIKRFFLSLMIFPCSLFPW